MLVPIEVVVRKRLNGGSITWGDYARQILSQARQAGYINEPYYVTRKEYLYGFMLRPKRKNSYGPSYQVEIDSAGDSYIFYLIYRGGRMM